jgi:N-methylhydantoinase A/oxoprolinase/acetone carboxylase beta subunit
VNLLPANPSPATSAWEHRVVVGIDTGGTFTDAVLMDGAGTVLGTVKEPTTHDRLEIGIRNAITALLQRTGVPPARIAHVAISTTLATNAVVEGKGCPVGLILVGFPEYVDLPAARVKYVRGGHTIAGDEQEPLDLEALGEAVADLKGSVEAYAVCALMSVVNPTHELVAAKAIQLLDPLPVFCSHQTSGQFGLKERAATTLFNAGLVPTMTAFLSGVKDALENLGVGGELWVVTGDGQAVTAEAAAAAPATTVCSGPAASAVFGASAVSDTAVVVDVGGTTSDISLVAQRAPLLGEKGSRIGSWQTHVRAVESRTTAVGGDSRVVVSPGTAALSHERVLPVALAAHHGDLAARLADSSSCRGFLPLPHAPTAILQADPALAFMHRRGGVTFEELRRELAADTVTLEAHLKELKRLRLAVEVGFTLTDVWHVEGRVALGDASAARPVAEALAKIWGRPLPELTRHLCDLASRSIELSILDFMMGRELDLDMSTFLSRRQRHRLLEVTLRLKAPIVGLGAAAPMLLPEVGSSLGVEVIFPPHYQVGNAVGAARLVIAHLPKGDNTVSS